MASFRIGRGRGRGQLLAAAVVRPGSDELKASKYQPLDTDDSPKQENDISQLNKLVKNALADPTVDKLGALLHGCSSLVSQEEERKKLVELLFTQSFKDREVAANCGLIVQYLTLNCGDNGRQVRAVFLKSLQNGFKTRSDLCEKSHEAYLAQQTLLCGVYAHLRVNDNEYIEILGKPVLTVLTELIEGMTKSPPQREEEIDTFHTCLLSVGGMLQQNYPEKMDDLVAKIRTTILNKASPKMRCQLLELLEYSVSKNWSMKNKQRIYYADLLSDIMAKNS